MSGLRFGLVFAMAVALCASPRMAAAMEVQEIRVERRGGGLIEEDAVRAFTSVKVGDELTRAALARDVRALEQSGRYAYVATKLEDGATGVVVTYVVQSKPRIRMIRIVGAEEIGNAKVRALLELGPGDLVDDSVLAFKAVKVREHYQKKYYPHAKLTWSLVPNEEAGTVDVLISVSEGRRASISRIRFEGDIPDPGRGVRAWRAIFPWFSPQPPVIGHDLRKVMKQRQRNMWSWITSAGTYKPEELNADPESIRRLLMDRGYLDATVGDPSVNQVGSKNLNVSIPVNEGERYHFGEIKVEGPKTFPPSEVQASIASRPNDLATLVAIERAQQAVRDYYGSRGYIRSDVQYRLRPHDGSPVVDMDVAVRAEGEQAVVRDVVIRGNTRTKDKVIRREIPVMPGDVYDQVKVRTSEARLRNLGFFDFVSAVPEDTAKPNEFDLSIEVNEQRTGQFLVGAGFSSVDNLIGFAELSQGNFDLFSWPPVGGGQKLRLRADLGTKRDDLEVSFTEPWFLDRRLALNVNLFRRSSRYYSSLYEQQNLGGDLGISAPLAPFTRLNLSYGVERIKIDDVDEDASEFFQAQAGTFLKSALNLSIVRDTRDSVFVPTRGARASIGGLWAGGPLGGDVDVYGLDAQVSSYWSVWFDHVFNLRASSSVVEPHGDMDDVPIFERQFVGGARSLRGFKYRKVGPVDEDNEPIGGQTMWYATAEYTIPVFERMRLATFYDIGYVNADAYEWKLSDYVSDWGVGIRLDFPMFPLRLDYAWPLETEPNNPRKSGRFQFTIGYAY